MNPGDESLDLGQLLRHPREDLSVEFKQWIDLSDEMQRATVAKALLALANFGGGYVIFGFVEVDGQHVVASNRPDSLSTYSQDTINDIVRRYAEPSFQCAVHHVSHPDVDAVFPVVVVPGGQRIPIRAKSDDPAKKHVRNHCYYTRRIGPASDTIQTGQEWDDLIRRCVLAGRDDLFASFRHILYGVSNSPAALPKQDRAREWETGCTARFNNLVAEELADEKPSRYENGLWKATYALDGNFPHPDQFDLREILRSVSGHETGWPPWWVPTREGIAPYPIDGFIECWMKNTKFNDGAHSDFWRASPDGRLFLLRGHHEDSAGRFAPGSTLVFSSPMWEVGQILLHIRRFSEAVHAEGTAAVRMHWTGLMNRRLSSWRGGSYDFPAQICRQDSVESEVALDLSVIDEALPECVAKITKPLFMAFDFYVPPRELYENEINQMRQSRIHKW
jgi:hypothetical protein